MTHVIAGGIGNRARSLCSEISIEVIAGAKSGEGAALEQQYLNGELATADHLCNRDHH